MSCNNPLYALDLGINPDNGKRLIKIIPKRADLSSISQLEARYGHGAVLPLPCGKCLACKLSKAREWAIRCTLEASLYDDNCFITLTYDPEHLPADGKVSKKALQDFFKRLRKITNFRYFACGEYGGQFHRPHYHMIIFGWMPDDVKKGSSKLLEKLWPFGFNDVKELHFNRCQYVARYTTKKIGSDNGEFLMMSTHPGLGTGWLNKHWDIFELDKVCGPFGIGSIPRYFEKLAENAGLDLSELKEERINKASDIKLHELLLLSFDRVEKLYDYKNNILVHDFAKKGALRKC